MKPNYKGLSLIVILIVGYSGWLYWEETQKKDELLQQSRIFKHKLESCSEIKFQNPKQKVYLVKEYGNWKITKPLQDLASSAAVNAVIKPIESQQYRKVNTNKEPEYFGLDNIHYKFSAQCESHLYELKFSKQLGPSKVHYILINNEIYVGGSAWHNLLQVNLPYLRESYILPELPKITNIKYKLQSEPKALNIKLSGQKWVSQSNPELKTEQVNKYLKGLENLTAKSFYSDFISKKLMSETGLISPVLKIEIKYQDNYNKKRVMRLSLSKKHDRYFLTSSSRNPIFEISSKDAENMLWLYDDFNMSTKDGENIDKY